MLLQLSPRYKKYILSYISHSSACEKSVSDHHKYSILWTENQFYQLIFLNDMMTYRNGKFLSLSHILIKLSFQLINNLQSWASCSSLNLCIVHIYLAWKIQLNLPVEKSIAVVCIQKLLPSLLRMRKILLNNENHLKVTSVAAFPWI